MYHWIKAFKLVFKMLFREASRDVQTLQWNRNNQQLKMLQDENYPAGHRNTISQEQEVLFLVCSNLIFLMTDCHGGSPASHHSTPSLCGLCMGFLMMLCFPPTLRKCCWVRIWLSVWLWASIYLSVMTLWLTDCWSFQSPWWPREVSG